MLFTVVVAHFTLIGSREQAKWPTVNERFWPIGGGATLRPILDCLQIPPTAPHLVPSGNYTIHWEIGNGADHIGMCKAFLIDTKTGEQQLVGQQNNCVHDTQSLEIDLSKHTCTSCVIKATVAADHLGPDKIENYDSCLDVNFSGQSSTSSDPVVAPSDPVAAPPATIPTPSETTLSATYPIAAPPVGIPSPTDEAPLATVPGLESVSTEATAPNPSYPSETQGLLYRRHKHKHNGIKHWYKWW